MSKIQFRVENFYNYGPISVIIININDKFTLFDIEENKYVIDVVYTGSIFPNDYTKYINIFNKYMFPVNYSGKINHNFINIRDIIPLQNGKLHGNGYNLDKLNKIIRFFNVCYSIENLSSHRYFDFTETGKLKFLINTLMKTEFEFYLNGKIKSYKNYHKGEHFKFTENYIKIN